MANLGGVNGVATEVNEKLLVWVVSCSVEQPGRVISYNSVKVEVLKR